MYIFIYCQWNINKLNIYISAYVLFGIKYFLEFQFTCLSSQT